jgi:hypothetical protein
LQREAVLRLLEREEVRTLAENVPIDLKRAVDLGVGLRSEPIGERRTLRVDAAWGLGDGDFALSMGWMLPWPGCR